MTLPVSPNAISFGAISTELGLSATATRTLNDANGRTLAGAGASGTTISISMFHGKANAFNFTQTISANTTNYNLKAAAITAGWNQTTKLAATITINAGIYVYSTATGTYAFDTGSTFPVGTTLALINNGIILGKGGNGGAGGSYNVNPGNAGAGSAAGPAFIARQAISVTNNGTIAGGGGGGGGGASSG